jgi:hypothetical protein
VSLICTLYCQVVSVQRPATRAPDVSVEQNHLVLSPLGMAPGPDHVPRLTFVTFGRDAPHSVNPLGPGTLPEYGSCARVVLMPLMSGRRPSPLGYPGWRVAGRDGSKVECGGEQRGGSGECERGCECVSDESE